MSIIIKIIIIQINPVITVMEMNLRIQISINLISILKLNWIQTAKQAITATVILFSTKTMKIKKTKRTTTTVAVAITTTHKTSHVTQWTRNWSRTTTRPTHRCPTMNYSTTNSTQMELVHPSQIVSTSCQASTMSRSTTTISRISTRPRWTSMTSRPLNSPTLTKTSRVSTRNSTRPSTKSTTLTTPITPSPRATGCSAIRCSGPSPKARCLTSTTSPRQRNSTPTCRAVPTKPRLQP